MNIRQPKFDFSRTPAKWTVLPEFAHSMNASSTAIPHLERFLNRVMAKAKASIDGTDPASQTLRADISNFIKQESCHYAMHSAFNEILVRDGYDRIPEFEAIAIEHYANLLKTKSLPFLVAYCEGFETLGPPAAISWLDEVEELLEGADPEAVALWKWHLLEEYEHRTVCYDAFKHIHGGYFLRVYAMFYQAFFLFRYSAKVQAYLLEQDRKGMTQEQIAQSKRNVKLVTKPGTKRMLMGFLKALSPFYTPRNAPEPKNFKSYMQKVAYMQKAEPLAA